MTTFADLGLSPKILKALELTNMTTPTPIQAQAIPHVRAGRDLLGVAQTGTGKTAAFTLPLLHRLHSNAPARARMTRTLVIAPTRELALQVAREFEWLYENANAKIATCVGGMDYRTEKRVLDRGAHVVVGTPGRLRDHIERGSLKLEQISAVVLDEADEMLDLGFEEDLAFILGACPAERRTHAAPSPSMLY
jgi:ATP-dependent RNA helicase DeaD